MHLAAERWKSPQNFASLCRGRRPLQNASTSVREKIQPSQDLDGAQGAHSANWALSNQPRLSLVIAASRFFPASRIPPAVARSRGPKLRSPKKFRGSRAHISTPPVAATFSSCLGLGAAKRQDLIGRKTISASFVISLAPGRRHVETIAGGFKLERSRLVAFSQFIIALSRSDQWRRPTAPSRLVA